MMHRVSVEYGMRATLPASTEAVEEFFIEFRRLVQTWVSRADRFTAELLLREALANAVVHGCQGDITRRIRCTLRLRGRRLIIAVRDGGEGFAWRLARERRAAYLSSSGRGIDILQRYATRVRFNKRGNAVTIIKVFS